MAGFVEPGRDHRRGVVAHAGGKPLAGRGRRRSGRLALVLAVGQDVGDRPANRGRRRVRRDDHPEQVAAARTDGTAHVQVGFRPEDTELVGPQESGMPIHVDLVEELGSDSYVYGTVALEGHNERFVVRVDSRHAPQLGEIVYVKPRVGSHNAFHAVNGKRL